MILNDAYAGHRKWWDADWKEDPALASVWVEWDYVLLRAYQYMEDYTTQNGHPVWVEEDPDIEWEFDKRVSYYEKEMHAYRDSHELKEWETPHGKPHWEDLEEPPSMKKWLQRMDDEASGVVRGGPAQRGRPPTIEERENLDRIQAEAQNR